VLPEDVIAQVIAELVSMPGQYGEEPPEPHPLAAVLTLPDGEAAPECLRQWAAFDNYYPFQGSRSDVAIADGDGVLLVQPMAAVLRHVCLESVEDELEDDEETLSYLADLVDELTGDFPGFGVVLSDEHPDPVLWIAPAGKVTVIWYHRDAFDRQEPFADAVARIREA
jgi:hypothetical protein